MKHLSARKIVERVAAGEETVQQVAKACLDRIAECDSAVQAWAYLDPDRVMAEAKRLDAAPSRGALHGLPIAVKDIFDTFDMPTEYGSPIYKGNQPTADAACVAILRGAGALLVGKTVTTEFAASSPGKTRNPFDPKRTPGGSSSGSAAAVGAGMVPAALATQTMGSLIRPAAYCGAVGFKPSYGNITRAGVKPQAASMDTFGAIGHSLDDAALVASVMMDGQAGGFRSRHAYPPRIAIFRGPEWSKAEAPAVAVLDQTAKILAAAGAQMTEIDPPQILQDACDAQLIMLSYEMSRGLSDEWLRHRDQISGVMRNGIARGWEYSITDYDRAEAVAVAARRWMAEAFQSCDLWLTLSAPGEAPEGINTGDTIFNRLWTFLHLPAITLPAGRGPNGMPLGVQLIGRFRGDDDLIAFGRWAEERLQ